MPIVDPSGRRKGGLPAVALLPLGPPNYPPACAYIYTTPGRQSDPTGRRRSLIIAPAWRFWRCYLLRRGFLDGWHGLIYAYVRANYVR